MTICNGIHTMYIRILCLATVTLFTSCGFQQEAGSGSEAGNSSRIASLTDSLFIKIPSSATGNTSPALHKAYKVFNEEDMLSHYASIRGFIGFANELVHNNDFGIKKIVKTCRDSLPWQIIEKQQNMSGKMKEARWVASFNEIDSFPYQITILVDSNSLERVAFSLKFNGSPFNPKGKAFYRMDLLAPKEVKGICKIELEFSAKSSERALNLSLTSEAILDDSLRGFKNLVLQLYEKNNVLHISGASYHPDLHDLLPDTIEYCYDFYGFCDTLKNLSLLNVALPPAAINRSDSVLFTEYSLASIILKKIIRTDFQTLNDTLKRCIVTSYKDSLTFKAILDSIKIAGLSWLRPSSGISDMTIEDLYYFLELNKSSDDMTIKKLLLLKLLKQPVYFNRSGYAGNNIAPKEFEALVLNSRVLPLQNPNEIKNLRVKEW